MQMKKTQTNKEGLFIYLLYFSFDLRSESDKIKIVGIFYSFFSLTAQYADKYKNIQFSIKSVERKIKTQLELYFSHKIK